MLSTVLIENTFLSFEPFLSKICRRSSGNGCGGGTMTAIDLVEESPGFDKGTSVLFSIGLELLRCNTIAEN